MSIRLQVLVGEADLAKFRRIARRRGMTVSAWVRRVLLESARRSPQGDVARKMVVLRAAARHSFPAPDIDAMLAEIERGYSGDES